MATTKQRAQVKDFLTLLRSAKEEGYITEFQYDDNHGMLVTHSDLDALAAVLEDAEAYEELKEENDDLRQALVEARQTLGYYG